MQQNTSKLFEWLPFILDNSHSSDCCKKQDITTHKPYEMNSTRTCVKYFIEPTTGLEQRKEHALVEVYANFLLNKPASYPNVYPIFSALKSRSQTHLESISVQLTTFLVFLDRKIGNKTPVAADNSAKTRRTSWALGCGFGDWTTAKALGSTLQWGVCLYSCSIYFNLLNKSCRRFSFLLADH